MAKVGGGGGAAAGCKGGGGGGEAAARRCAGPRGGGLVLPLPLEASRHEPVGLDVLSLRPRRNGCPLRALSAAPRPLVQRLRGGHALRRARALHPAPRRGGRRSRRAR